MTQMKRLAVVMSLALVLVPGVGRLSAQSGYDLFQKGLAAERADGNLNQAIELYQRVVKESVGDRALAATALVQMGRVYEKLGRPDALETYERVVREFAGESTSAAAARTRLAAMQTAAAAQVGQSVRLLWNDLGRAAGYAMGAPSADGRYLSFSQGLSLGILDLKAGKTVSFTDPPGNAAEVEASVVSPDGRQAAYVWCYDQSPCELRVVQVNSGKAAKSRVVHLNNGYIGVHGWSPDGKSVVVVRVVQRGLPDRRDQIAVISMADGSVRVLRDNVMDGGGASFSPDGRYVAYHARTANGTAANRDIFVVTMDGREARLAEAPGDERNPMWSPDGSYIVFLSDRTGNLSLWTVPVAAGAATGPAKLVKAIVEPFIPLGITRSGALYYVVGPENSIDQRVIRTTVYTANLDAKLNVAGEPAMAVNRFINSSRAGVWSSDGRSLAYLASSPRGVAIRIRSMQTDDDREVPTVIPVSGPVRWFPDGQSLLVPSQDARLLNGDLGYYRVNVASGRAELLHQTPFRNVLNTVAWRPDLSPDGKAIFYLETPLQPVRFDIESGRETKLTPVGNSQPLTQQPLSLAVSPDGTQVAYVGAGSLVVAPATGGEPREVVRFSGESGVRERLDGLGLAWSPDGRYLFFVKPGVKAIWRVPLDGGAPENIGVPISRMHTLRMHPDGRRIAFESVIVPPSEVWVLENFLPKRTASK